MKVMLPLGTRPGPGSQVRLFRSGHGDHLFVADGSRIYDIPPATAARIEACLTDPAGGAEALVRELLADGGPRIDGRPAEPPPLAALSFNVMQACNMSCGYCYADEGRFGGAARAMTPDVARAAVDRLIAESAPGADVVLGFMGGEPLLARGLLHETTRYAARAAAGHGRRIRFAVTTNLTTVRPEDAALFAEYPFTVAVSVDGGRSTHDAVRRMRDGSSAYERVVAGLRVLERHGRPRHLGARVTVTPRTGPLLPVLDHLIGLGFDEVGFAAVLASPDDRLAFTAEDFPAFLDRMVECGEEALRRIGAGEHYPFGNFETAMQQLHRGTHRPYPCGAGAGYLSAGASGDLFACHRLVDDPAYAMGDVTGGSDRAARAAHLARSHVDGMEPCRGCWARYLCGGGCYHEVARRGRPGCGYIRGWLEFCLRAYVELGARRPAYFTRTAELTFSDPTTVAR